MIKIFKQDSFAIILFAFDHLVLDKIRQLGGRCYHPETKYLTIHSDKIEEFFASCDKDSLPYEINNQTIESAKSFETIKNKQQCIANLRFQDQSALCIRVKQWFIHRFLLSPHL